MNSNHFVAHKSAYRSEDVIQKLESVLTFKLPEDYIQFIIEFEKFNFLTLLIDPIPKVQGLDLYFTERMVIEEIFNLDTIEKIYFEEKFLNLQLIKQMGVLPIGTFLGSRDMIGLGFIEGNYNQIIFLDGDQYPMSNEELEEFPNFGLNLEISFNEFISREKEPDSLE